MTRQRQRGESVVGFIVKLFALAVLGAVVVALFVTVLQGALVWWAHPR